MLNIKITVQSTTGTIRGPEILKKIESSRDRIDSKISRKLELKISER